jgi:hypothetical protein
MIDGTKRMDTDALLALWEDDGVSILQEMAPIVGKAAIAKFVRAAVGQMPGRARALTRAP